MVKINLLLSGAGAKGSYFTGFLYTLFTTYKEHFEINNIYGTSAGALVGFLVASGNIENLKIVFDIRSRNDIASHWITTPYLNVICMPFMSYYKKGMLDPSPVHTIIKKVKIEPINHLHKLNVATFNMTTHQTEYFNCGNGIFYDYLFGSMALPCIFPPHQIQGKDYSDGSFTEFIPVSQVDDTDTDSINLLLSARYTHKIIQPKNMVECIHSFIMANCKAFYDINMEKAKKINNIYIYEIDRNFEHIETLDISIEGTQQMWLNGSEDAHKFVLQLKNDGKIN